MVGPVPPPYGGIASVLDDIIHSDLSTEYRFDLFERGAVFPAGAVGPVGRTVFRVTRFARFFRTVLGGDYSFVHFHSADSAFIGTAVFVLLTRCAGGKILLHMHGTDWDIFYQKQPWLRKFVTRTGLRLANRMVVLYRLWQENIGRLLPHADVHVLRNRIHEIGTPNEIDVQQLRGSLGLSDPNFVVLMVGSVGSRKGCFEILKAVSEIVREDDSIRFLLVGGEEYPGEMGQLLDIIQAQGLGQWVRLTGEVEREQIPLFFALADVFLLPSFIEGMPISILEAMRSSLPVIATPVAGIPEVVEDGVTGLLVNPGSPPEIAEAVLRLRRDEPFRRSCGTAGRAAFEANFEFAKGVEELRTLYETM